MGSLRTDVRVVIDHRESKAKMLIKEEYISKYNISYENLEHGDMVIYFNDAPIFVFERKTIADLKASIHDGRYKNQKLKMLEKYNNKSIYYIIEGDVGVQEESVRGAIINTMMRDNICVFMTKDINDTIYIIYGILDRVIKDPYKYIGTQEVASRQVVVSNDDSTFVNMLCQIPSISLKTAKAVQSVYSSSFDMINSLYEKNHNEKLNSLKDIFTYDTKGKGRRISKVAADNILKEYFGNGEG